MKKIILISALSISLSSCAIIHESDLESTVDDYYENASNFAKLEHNNLTFNIMDDSNTNSGIINHNKSLSKELGKGFINGVTFGLMKPNTAVSASVHERAFLKYLNKYYVDNNCFEECAIPAPDEVMSYCEVIRSRAVSSNVGIEAYEVFYKCYR